MRKLALTLCLLALTGPLTLASEAPEAPSSLQKTGAKKVTWRVTSFSLIEFNGAAGSEKEPAVVARFGGNDRQRILGTFDGTRVEGFWVREKSGVRCETARDGSHFWGNIELSITPKGKVLGHYTRCNGPEEIHVIGKLWK